MNHVTKEFIRDKEAVYFAFPVASAKPSFSYEIQNGWVDPSKDMLKGAGLEWFSVGHWVKASAGDAQRSHIVKKLARPIRCKTMISTKNILQMATNIKTNLFREQSQQVVNTATD